MRYLVKAQIQCIIEAEEPDTAYINLQCEVQHMVRRSDSIIRLEEFDVDNVIMMMESDDNEYK